MSKRFRPNQESGASKRKKKAKEDAFLGTQKGALDKFIMKPSTSSSADTEEKSSSSEYSSTGDEERAGSHSDVGEATEYITKEQEAIADTAGAANAEIDLPESPSPDIQVDWTDPALWPSALTHTVRTFLIEKGPCRDTSYRYPKDASNRHFSNEFYQRKLPNGETANRQWLVYSKSKDAVFCFCCKLFANSKNRFISDGNNDWSHMARDLQEHESSSKHLDALKMCIELEMRLKKCATIDKKTEELINTERAHWNGVLKRILSIVQFLAQRNLAFRGTVDRLFEPNNGNFLGLVELLGKYDHVMQEHLRRVKNDEIHDHYLGKRIQNEVIELMGSKVLASIVSRIQNAKYYSIILDCTPDISHQEQMTMVLRIVDMGSIEVQEFFVGYLPVESSTGLGLTEVCLKKLEELGIPIEYCRGQGYDNGANMKGCNSGVQKRILEINPKAFFVPCGCHSLNLVLGDMAKSSKIAMTLFGILHQVYLLFAASTQRWAILKSHVKDLTVKPISETRWECRIDSVKAVRFQVGSIYDALIEVSESANDPKARTEAAALAHQIKNYQFLVSLVIWYDLLLQVNIVSKLMQSDSMKLDIAIQCLGKTTDFLSSYKKTGFLSAKITAKELAEELEMGPDDMFFPQAKTVRRKKVKRQFEYESHDDPIADPEEKFRIEFFNVLLDQALMSLTERFQQMKGHSDFFGFLYDYDKIRNMGDDQLRKFCSDLHGILTDNHGSDIDPADLANELKMLASLLTSQSTAIGALKFIQDNKLSHAVPNAAVALRILLTIPITVASGERSFSKLKLIKTYLRSTMSQDRLNSLALLSIERKIVESIDFKDIVKAFADKKARKVAF